MRSFAKAVAGLAAAGMVMLATGCARGAMTGAGSPPPGLVAGLWTADKAYAGLASAHEVAGGVAVRVTVEGLAPGRRGVHVHAVGACEPPDFESAGAHWNPTGRQHGTMNPMGPHAGDMPNLEVGADGKGTLAFTLPGATLAGLRDADGAALVVHAAEDDLKTDPSGNSGDRIACGVFESAS